MILIHAPQDAARLLRQHLQRLRHGFNPAIKIWQTELLVRRVQNVAFSEHPTSAFRSPTQTASESPLERRRRHQRREWRVARLVGRALLDAAMALRLQKKRRPTQASRPLRRGEAGPAGVSRFILAASNRDPTTDTMMLSARMIGVTGTT